MRRTSRQVSRTAGALLALSAVFLVADAGAVVARSGYIIESHGTPSATTGVNALHCPLELPRLPNMGTRVHDVLVNERTDRLTTR
jgi:hypothetical protein